MQRSSRMRRCTPNMTSPHGRIRLHPANAATLCDGPRPSADLLRCDFGRGVAIIEKVCSRRNAVTLVDLGATMSLMKSATPTLALPYL